MEVPTKIQKVCDTSEFTSTAMPVGVLHGREVIRMLLAKEGLNAANFQNYFSKVLEVCLSERSLLDRSVQTDSISLLDEDRGQGSLQGGARFFQYMANQVKLFIYATENSAEQKALAFDVLQAMAWANSMPSRYSVISIILNIYERDFEERKYSDWICDVLKELSFDKDEQVRTEALGAVLRVIADSYTTSDRIELRIQSSGGQSSSSEDTPRFNGVMYMGSQLKEEVARDLKSDDAALKAAVNKQVKELLEMKDYGNSDKQAYQDAINYILGLVANSP